MYIYIYIERERDISYVFISGCPCCFDSGTMCLDVIHI